MAVGIEQRIAETGSQALRWLVAGCAAERSDLWGLSPDNPDHVPLICKTAAQLIESVNWLECHEEVYPRVQHLCEYLIRQTTRQPAQLSVHASRLKAVLQFSRHSEIPSGWQSVFESLRDLTSRVSSPPDDLFDLVCLTDLMGYALSLWRKTPGILAGVRMGADLQRNMAQKHGECLDYIQAIVNEPPSPAAAGFLKNPRHFSFFIWQLFISGRFDVKGRDAQMNPKFGDAVDRLRRTTTDYDSQHRPNRRYDAHHFPEIVYPKLLLAWLNRKQLSHTPLDEFFEWLDIQTRHLMETGGDPFHVGLALKAFVAANKTEVRRHLRQASFTAALDADSARSSAQQIALRATMEDVLRHAFQPKVDSVEPLMAGWSLARVYRTSWNMLFPASTIRNQATPRPFVVKLGPRDDFTRAASKYAGLSTDAKRLFPAHDVAPSVLSSGVNPLFYLVMEELSTYDPLGKLLAAQLPQDRTAGYTLPKLRELADAGFDAIASLHGSSVVSWSAFEEGAVGSGYLRLSRIFESVDSFVRHNPRFARLPWATVVVKDTLDHEFSLSHPKETLRQVLNSEGRTAPKSEAAKNRLVLVHGDCHSHNIMVKRSDLRDYRFVDVDGLRRDDYLLDHAAFVAHVCFSLPFERIPNDEIELTVSDVGDPKKLGISVDCQEWGHLAVQRELFNVCMNRVEHAIDARGEGKEARVRFYLFLARRLLFVASKSRRANKAVIFYLQGMSILERTSRDLHGCGSLAGAAVPFSAIELRAS